MGWPVETTTGKSSLDNQEKDLKLIKRDQIFSNLSVFFLVALDPLWLSWRKSHGMNAYEDTN